MPTIVIASSTRSGRKLPRPFPSARMTPSPAFLFLGHGAHSLCRALCKQKTRIYIQVGKVEVAEEVKLVFSEISGVAVCDPELGALCVSL